MHETQAIMTPSPPYLFILMTGSVPTGSGLSSSSAMTTVRTSLSGYQRHMSGNLFADCFLKGFSCYYYASCGKERGRGND